MATKKRKRLREEYRTYKILGYGFGSRAMDEPSEVIQKIRATGYRDVCLKGLTLLSRRGTERTEWRIFQGFGHRKHSKLLKPDWQLTEVLAKV
jgi:hypothetical protein